MGFGDQQLLTNRVGWVKRASQKDELRLLLQLTNHFTGIVR